MSKEELSSATQAVIDADRNLTAEQLDDKYNPKGDGEHPLYTRASWRNAVEQHNTVSGYWDWVTHHLCSDEGAPGPGAPTPKATLGDWHMELCDKGEYLQLRYSNRPGDIQLRAGDQGFAVAFVPESGGEPVFEQWAEYRQLSDK